MGLNRWTAGILVGFAIVIGANGVLVWCALHLNDPVEPSYQTEPR